MKTPEELANEICAYWTEQVEANVYFPAAIATVIRALQNEYEHKLALSNHRIAELEKALEPFAALANVYLLDDTEITHFQGRLNLKVSHCRHAAEVLGRGKG